MPKGKGVTHTVVRAGKKVLATDAAQGVVGAVADKMEEIAVDKADDAAEIVKEKAARAGGRRPSSRRSATTRKTGARKATTRKTGARKTGARKTGARKATLGRPVLGRPVLGRPRSEDRCSEDRRSEDRCSEGRCPEGRCSEDHHSEDRCSEDQCRKTGARKARKTSARTGSRKPRPEAFVVMTGYVKSLWVSIQGDPVFMQRVNGWLTIFWIAMIPISIATGWINSVAYVASLSLWALVSGHWSAWQAARVEVAQKKEEERRAAEDMAGEIVERVVEETTVEKQR